MLTKAVEERLGHVRVTIWSTPDISERIAERDQENAIQWKELNFFAPSAGASMRVIIVRSNYL